MRLLSEQQDLAQYILGHKFMAQSNGAASFLSEHALGLVKAAEQQVAAQLTRDQGP